MDMRRVLPKFELGIFVKNVGKGVEEQARRQEFENEERRIRKLKEALEISDQNMEDAKERRFARQEVEKKKAEQESWKNMWTTSGLRPLAEPPIFDWDWIFRTKVPSDLRYRRLFPDDPGKRAAIKDLDGELIAQLEYSCWAKIMGEDEDTDGTRRAFYDGLKANLDEDSTEVINESWDLRDTATELAIFEYIHLDNDGRTTGLEQWIAKGADVFWDLEGDDLRRKYGPLVPLDFVENRLATFEFKFLDDDLGFGTSELEKLLELGFDVLTFFDDEEVHKKYGHLYRFYRSVPASPAPASPISAAHSTDSAHPDLAPSPEADSFNDAMRAFLLSPPDYPIAAPESEFLPKDDSEEESHVRHASVY